jgi:hypothetical protein
MKYALLEKPETLTAAAKLSPRDRVRKHRESLRAQGLRPIQIWVPDTRQPGFAEKVHSQCVAVNDPEHDREVFDFMDAVMADTEWN